MGRRGSGSTRCSGELATSSRKYSALEGYGNKYWPTRSSVLAWRTASLTEKPGRPQSTGSQPVGHCQSDSVHTGTSIFFARGSSAPVRADPEGSAAAWLAGGPGGLRCAGPWAASAAGVMALSVFFFFFSKCLVAGDQKASLASLSP